MRPPCETVVRYVLPAFRSLVARELITKYGFSQVDTAKKLGTTQAAISQYVSSKRGSNQLKKLESLPEVRSVAQEVASDIATSGLASMDSINMFCTLCEALRKEEPVCSLHRESVGLPSDCNACK